MLTEEETTFWERGGTESRFFGETQHAQSNVLARSDHRMNKNTFPANGTY